MKFSFHIQEIVDSTSNALALNKEQLVPAIQEVLLAAKSLLRTNELDFWITQLNETEIDELPLTHCGLKEAREIWDRRHNMGRQELSGSLYMTCEYLFTYCNEDDLCEIQAQYHYYFYIPENRVFKESQLGSTALRLEGPIPTGDFRIARKSELSFVPEEFIQ